MLASGISTCVYHWADVCKTLTLSAQLSPAMSGLWQSTLGVRGRTRYSCGRELLNFPIVELGDLKAEKEMCWKRTRSPKKKMII
jgi:hypothetical protein